MFDYERRQDTTSSSDLPAPTLATTEEHTASVATVSLSSSTLTILPTTSRTTVSPNPTSHANSTLFNVPPLPEGQLPLEPEITPGWGIAGTLLILTGVPYTLIGIRAKRVQTFFSAAFTGALGTTVLILYLMTLPVTPAVQGAFVVAALCAGAALGGVAVLFRDLTEGLGCLLGGLCFSMWLLALQPGGLIRNSTGKAVFIAAFSLLSCCLYISHWTRRYGLVCGIALSGATATVLGIDCFSRAGLKEFWAYIWALNEELFPDGAVTYPLTRGIRVELAVAILLFAVGVISQLRVWRMIRARRDEEDGKKEEGRLSDEEAVLPSPLEEEERIGRRVEATVGCERIEWERRYGNGGGGTQDEPTSRDVGGAQDQDDDKRGGSSEHMSVTEVTEVMEVQGLAELPGGHELRDPAGKISRKEMAMGHGLDDDDESLPVRVVIEDEQDTAECAPRESQSTQTLLATTTANVSSCCDDTPAPYTVPTPFTVRRTPRPRDEEDGSSVAAVVGEEDRPEVSVRDSESHGSWASVPVSQLARCSMDSVINLGAFSATTSEWGNGPPIVPSPARNNSTESGSVVAHLDDDEIDDGKSMGDTAASETSQRASRGKSTGRFLISGEKGRTQEETVCNVSLLDSADELPGSKIELPDPVDNSQEVIPKTEEASETGSSGPAVGEPVVGGWVRVQDIRQEGTEPRDIGSRGAGAGTRLMREDLDNLEICERCEEDPGDRADREDLEDPEDPMLLHVVKDRRGPTRSGEASTTTTTNAYPRLTQGSLPAGLSDVAVTYRTNEWAKHLSSAETPDPGDLDRRQGFVDGGMLISERADDGDEGDREQAVPLDMRDLQRTAAVEDDGLASATAITMASGSPPYVSPELPSELPCELPADVPLQRSPEGPPPKPRVPSRYRASPSLMRRQSTPLHAEVIPEEGSQLRSASRMTLQPQHQHQQQRRRGSAQPALGRSNTHGHGHPYRHFAPSMSTRSISDPIRPSSSASTIQAPKQQPQTLIGMREKILRHRASGLMAPPSQKLRTDTNDAFQESLDTLDLDGAYDAESIYEAPPPRFHPVCFSPSPGAMSRPVSADIGPGMGMGMGMDPDDMPLSHRRSMLFQSQTRLPAQAPTRPTALAESAAFNSHQPPRRDSANYLPSETVRQGRLARFRNDVAVDLHGPTNLGMGGAVGMATPGLLRRMPAPGAGGMSHTMAMNNITNNAMNPELMKMAAAAATATAAAAAAPPAPPAQPPAPSAAAIAAAQRREAEIAKREAEATMRLRAQWALEEHMRGSGVMADVHREAMRRMQGGVAV
ncbi:uncharacterized protein C8A04DRAFT_25855 [Dichotomopilus funicola]|uniref:TM7S3/TM198-like domain-containing protein n=1 Tax=Dichotomopilus funicola TaxID=1934379 RepID=A0AAN6ZRC7_9PEZI|nr:hypothetical protein C8A04DRAFT_25855 [Dichotomopilus funicola]